MNCFFCFFCQKVYYNSYKILLLKKMDGKLPLSDDFIDLLIKVLAASQLFMRNQKVLYIIIYLVLIYIVFIVSFTEIFLDSVFSLLTLSEECSDK